MENIEEFFLRLLSQHHSVDIADSDFKKQLAEDQDLKESYRQWCREVGSTERLGFRDWCEEYLENRDSVWDTLTDYDEE